MTKRGPYGSKAARRMARGRGLRVRRIVETCLNPKHNNCHGHFAGRYEVVTPMSAVR